MKPETAELGRKLCAVHPRRVGNQFGYIAFGQVLIEQTNQKKPSYPLRTWVHSYYHLNTVKRNSNDDSLSHVSTNCSTTSHEETEKRRRNMQEMSERSFVQCSWFTQSHKEESSVPATSFIHHALTKKEWSYLSCTSQQKYIGKSFTETITRYTKPQTGPNGKPERANADKWFSCHPTVH